MQAWTLIYIRSAAMLIVCSVYIYIYTYIYYTLYTVYQQCIPFLFVTFITTFIKISLRLFRYFVFG